MGACAAVARTLGLLAILFALGAWAQDDEAAPDSSADADEAAAEEETVEEIVVVGGRAGDPQRLDGAYEDALRQRILQEIERLEALQEEYDWRSEARPADESRIRWGYDPRDEYRARRDSELYDLPFDQARPAKIFSIEF